MEVEKEKHHVQSLSALGVTFQLERLSNRYIMVRAPGGKKGLYEEHDNGFACVLEAEYDIIRRLNDHVEVHKDGREGLLEETTNTIIWKKPRA